MKRLALPALAALCLSAAPASAATTHTVTIGRDTYSPAYLRIAPGDSVTWRNADSRVHTATALHSAVGFFGTGAIRPGERYTQLFVRAGRYAYLDAAQARGQRGVIQVGPDKVDPRVSKVSVRATSTKLVTRARLSEDARLTMVLRRDGKRVTTIKSGLAGEGGLTFTFRFRGIAALPRGSYRATVTATDTAGNRSRDVAAKFRVR